MLNTKLFVKSFFSLMVLLSSILLFTVVNFGQSVSATLTGTVKDQQGAVVPGANVTVSDTGTGEIGRAHV